LKGDIIAIVGVFILKIAIVVIIELLRIARKGEGS